MNFPELIKATREALRESQAEFAKRFESHANTVSRWESGKYQAPYDVISFVVGYARDLVWNICPHCHGLGRIQTRIGKRSAKEAVATESGPC